MRIFIVNKTTFICIGVNSSSAVSIVANAKGVITEDDLDKVLIIFIEKR